MNLNPGLRIEQKLHLAPQMQYTLTLLQMNADALLRHIQEQAMENPLIVLDAIPARKLAHSPLDDENVREIPDRRTEKTLRAHLIQQLPLDLTKELNWTVRHLIDALDPSGYFSDQQDDLAESLAVSTQLLNEALALLRGLDPPGVGAFSLSECLMLQIERRGDAPLLAYRIAQGYLHDAAAGRFRKIAREEHTSLRCVEEAFSYIQTLSPYPASGYHCAENCAYIIPDIAVVCENGTPAASLTDWSAPKLCRNSKYMDLLLHGEDADVLQYLRERTAAFSELEQAVAMRNRTLLAVANIIVDRQREFFLDATHPLRPLSLKDIGQELGLHTSTVSRAIQDKYLSCSWGVFPLRQFLSRYIPSEQPQELDQSGQDFVLRMIQELVDTEDPAMPLSDQQIFDKLQEKNIFISRRSVSNYREKLSIPSSYVRKRNSTI